MRVKDFMCILWHSLTWQIHTHMIRINCTVLNILQTSFVFHHSHFPDVWWPQCLSGHIRRGATSGAPLPTMASMLALLITWKSCPTIEGNT